MKFYTAFLYDAYSAEPHCTHKYLAALSVEDLCEVVRIVRAFRPQNLYGPRLAFDRIAEWKTSVLTDDGAVREDVYRVLLPRSEKGFEAWESVRDELKQFRPDEFAQYRPHITSLTETRIDKPFTHYGICSHGRVIFAWPLEIRGIMNDLSW